MKKLLSNLSIKLRMFFPILIGVIIVASIVTFIAIRITINNANVSIEQQLKQEVEILSKMFQRERSLKLEKVKSDLDVAHDMFISRSFTMSKKRINISAVNQVTGYQYTEQLNVFYLNKKPLHQDFTFVDKLQELLGGTATIFQKADSGYVRISTNVPKKDGSRAVGTYIPNNSPVIKAIEQGQVYYGRAYVVNDWYITAYEPIYYKNEIVGILYVGDKEKNLSELQGIFSKLTIGKTGYPFVIDQTGKVIMHPGNESVLQNDQMIIDTIVSRQSRSGIFKSRSGNRQKVVAYDFFDPFKVYIVAAITPKYETRDMTRQMVRNAILVGVVVVIVFLVFVYFVTTENVQSYLSDLEISKKKLKVTREALEQSEKLATMGQLSAGIAHAVSNPLGVITMHAHIMREEVNKDSTLYSDLSLITEQSERCKNILSGLLNFARTSEVVYQETNLHELINLVADEINIPETLDFKIEKKINHSVAYFDTRQIIQALKHLLNNAVEASGENGSVRFTIESAKDKVKFIVKDNGPGIPIKNRDKLFEPFFTTKQAIGGAGLGLPVSYGIIKMHMGQIAVESNDDPANGETGTTIIAEVPASNEQVK